MDEKKGRNIKEEHKDRKRGGKIETALPRSGPSVPAVGGLN